MFYANIADIKYCINNKYAYIKKMCKDYLIDEEEADMTINVTDEDILAEGGAGDFPPPYLESLAVYRKISDELTKNDGLLMHGVVLEVDNKGIGFLARSGTGKSTHMFLWKKFLGEKCTVVNGDKPLLRFIDDKVYAYGTPWAGKEAIQTNKKVELNKICFIERAKENSAKKISKDEALNRIFSQIYMPKKGLYRVEVLEKLAKLFDFADFYIIRCNMDISAAEVAYKGVMEDSNL